MLVLFLPALIDSDFGKSMTEGTKYQQSLEIPNFDLTLPIIIIGAVVTIAALALTVWALVKIPQSVGKTGKKITHRTTAFAVPLITHHKKLPPKKQTAISAIVILIIKMTLCLVPLVVTLLAPSPSELMPKENIVIIGAIFALLASIFFALQAASACLLKISYIKTW